MEDAGEVKHVGLLKFKDGVTEDQIEELIKGAANLVNLIPSMKGFRWGKDLSIQNLQQGFTHVFELIFESSQGIEEYIAHPAHVEFAKVLIPQLEKMILVDYQVKTVDV